MSGFAIVVTSSDDDDLFEGFFSVLDENATAFAARVTKVLVDRERATNRLCQGDVAVGGEFSKDGHILFREHDGGLDGSFSVALGCHGSFPPEPVLYPQAGSCAICL